MTLEPYCHWTEGRWDFGLGRLRRWDEVQNTGEDLHLLSRYLLDLYRERYWPRISRAQAE
jgi:hypothetical protein